MTPREGAYLALQRAQTTELTERARLWRAARAGIWVSIWLGLSLIALPIVAAVAFGIAALFGGAR